MCVLAEWIHLSQKLTGAACLLYVPKHVIVIIGFDQCILALAHALSQLECLARVFNGRVSLTQNRVHVAH